MKATDQYNFLLFALLALIWSVSFIGIKISVEAIPPIFSAMLRVAIALVFISLFFSIGRKKLMVPLSSCWRLWIVGLFSQGLPFAFLFWGEQFIPPALASILNATVSLWAFIFNIVIFRDTQQIAVGRVLGLAIGMSGIILIFWPTLMSSTLTSSVWGTLSVLAMAISYAMGALLNQHLVTSKMKTGFHANLWHQHCASLIFLALASLATEQWPSVNVLTYNHELIAALIYLGLFSTAIAWIIYYHLIREWDAVCASSVMYIVPVLALLWDFLYLHITPTLDVIYGSIAILIGVVLIQLSSKFNRAPN